MSIRGGLWRCHTAGRDCHKGEWYNNAQLNESIEEYRTSSIAKDLKVPSATMVSMVEVLTASMTRSVEKTMILCLSGVDCGGVILQEEIASKVLLVVSWDDDVSSRG